MRTKSQIGKANRAAGARFEAKGRKDLESKGWIVSRWSNNVKLEECKINGKMINLFNGVHELVPAKSTRFRSNTHGFPDFIVYRQIFRPRMVMNHYQIQGIEFKSNGYLNPEEKEKCKWLIKNNVFSKILIAKKGKKRGEIIYDDFE